MNSIFKSKVTHIALLLATSAVIYQFFNHQLHAKRQLSATSTQSATQFEKPTKVNKPSTDVSGLPSETNPISFEDAKKIAQSRLDPEMARLLLARAAVEVKNINERAKISSVILMALCQQGYSTEAWNLIDQSQGAVRSIEIGAFFRYDNSPLNQLLQKVKSFSDPLDRMNAWGGLLGARPMEVANLEASEFIVGSPEEKNVLTAHILTAMKGGTTSQSATTSSDYNTAKALLDKSIDLVKIHALDVGHLARILNNDNVSDAFYQWDRVRSLIDGPPIEGIAKNDLESLNAAVIPNMINSDPNRAMDLICSTQSTKYSYPILSTAIKEYYRASPDEANAWIIGHLDTIDPATSQRIISVVAQEANRNMEFETSRKWANRILNAEVRQQLLDQVAERESEKLKGPAR